MIGIKNEHPIERIMDNAFAKIKTIIDADTVIGNPVTTADGISIIPISRVSLGFVTGGGEYSDMSRTNYSEYPFAGGSGAGLSVVPIGFLINDGTTIKMINIEEQDDAYSKILDMIPGIIKGFVKKED
ncbi:MAG: GerW family sporulation protein [Clostridiales bacterium]|jgi:sporulation protein YtfJ|nr:GerW family sporulation protein [Clostridiales bacterium]